MNSLVMHDIFQEMLRGKLVTERDFMGWESGNSDREASK
jgi:hypothetical protein